MVLTMDAASPGTRAGSDPQAPRATVQTRLGVTVSAFSFERLELTLATVDSLLRQDPPPDEIFVVVDHNEPLRAVLEARVSGAVVLASEGPKGLSGARNTGLAHTTCPILAYVDDDAEAAEGWSEAILAPFVEPGVMSVGGLAVPRWDGGAPGWFPEEFLWAVGCSYRGMVTDGFIRNPLGCNMAFRTDAIRSVGGFDPALGRVGTLPFGCEETELCVRLRRADPDARVVLVRDAVVHHVVPPARRTLRYLWRRSYYEGIGKAMMRRVSDGGALGAEQSYALTVVPKAVLRDLAGMARLSRPRRRLTRIAAMVGSLGLAGVGYLVGLATRPTGPAEEAHSRAAP
jgi:glucosyl-dolichyl phosphate glucuronosyltransferase